MSVLSFATCFLLFLLLFVFFELLDGVAAADACLTMPSGSYTIIASDFALSGMLAMVIGGLNSWPIQVYFNGMGSLFLKAGLVTTRLFEGFVNEVTVSIANSAKGNFIHLINNVFRDCNKIVP